MVHTEMEFWTVLLTLLLIYLLYLYYFSGKNRFEEDDVPHIKPTPLFGNMGPPVRSVISMTDYLEQYYNFNKEAKYVGFYDFSTPTFMIRDPELIKEIGIKYFDNFVNHRGFTNPEVDPLFGNNLFSLKDDEWRELRNVLSPSFTSSKMRGMFELMTKCAENFVNHFIEKSKESGSAMTLGSKDVFGKFTNDVIASCALGITTDSLKNPNNDFYSIGIKYCTFQGLTALKFFSIRNFPRLSKWFKIQLIPENVNQFFQKIVAETMAYRDQEGIVRPDMIQLLMETRNKKSGNNLDLNLQMMTSQAFVFFLGGFDTTRGLLCFVAHQIAAIPEVQKKLQEEVDEIYQKSNGKPTYELIKNMEYLDAVINETHRLYPSAFILDRVCVKDFELPPPLPDKKPVRLRPGDVVWFPVAGVHRDPAYYPNPHEFIPERFIGNNSLTNSPVYIPFGIGPRICIGNRLALMQIKVLIFYLVANFTLKPNSKMKLPLKLQKGIPVVPEGGFWLDLQPRIKE